MKEVKDFERLLTLLEKVKRISLDETQKNVISFNGLEFPNHIEIDQIVRSYIKHLIINNQNKKQKIFDTLSFINDLKIVSDGRPYQIIKSENPIERVNPNINNLYRYSYFLFRNLKVRLEEETEKMGLELTQTIKKLSNFHHEVFYDEEHLLKYNHLKNTFAKAGTRYEFSIIYYFSSIVTKSQSSYCRLSNIKKLIPKKPVQSNEKDKKKSILERKDWEIREYNKTTKEWEFVKDGPTKLRFYKCLELYLSA